MFIFFFTNLLETVRQFDKTIRTAENNADRLNHLGPLLESPGPLPLAQSAKPNVNRDPLLDSDRPLPLARSAKPKVEIPDDMLSPSALKRREERRRRESEVLRLRERSLSRNRQPTENISLSDIMEIDEEEDISEIDPAELEHLSPMAEAPEFDGPEESISETLDDSLSGTVRYHPSGKGHDLVDVSKSPSYRLNPDVICSLVGGDYSQYTSLSSTMRKATSPNALTVVNTAELALSSQPDYIVPQRKEAIEIVKHLVDRSSYKAKLSDDTEPALFRGELEK